MILLALDTTGQPGSLALMREDRLLVERPGDSTRAPSERLPGEIAALVADLNLTLRDIDLFAVATGPGSFTGMRVGIATIQGLALAHGRSVVPVSTLEALAVRAYATTAAFVASWIDGQRGEVFAALYAPDPAGGREVDPATGLCEVASPVVGRPDEVLAAWGTFVDQGTGAVVFAGDGALAYRDAIRGTFGARVSLIEERTLLASTVAEVASRRAALGGAVLPGAVVPVYLRRSDAELARDRRARPGGLA
jgi:tRNA threonylcarbamoyladenosine biosynthesis protein TsaB